MFEFTAYKLVLNLTIDKATPVYLQVFTHTSIKVPKEFRRQIPMGYTSCDHRHKKDVKKEIKNKNGLSSLQS